MRNESITLKITDDSTGARGLRRGSEKRRRARNILCSLVAAFWLIGALGLTAPTAFAGDPNCQSGYISNPYNPPVNPVPPRETPTPTPRPVAALENREQKQLAAAQIRYERNQPPSGGDADARLSFSRIASMVTAFGGFWAFIVLLLWHFRKTPAQSLSQTRKIWSFAFQPRFALWAFAFLIGATVIGSQFTAPRSVSAEKRGRPDKKKMTGFVNPSNKPTFKTAQQLGGVSGVTQVGAPVFDAAGNKYVRGGFTETLTIGSTTLQSSGYFDAFVAKYAPDGTPLWARRGTGAGSQLNVALAVEGATALAVDQNGNVYIGGSFVKTLTLQGGANQSATLTDNRGGTNVNYESFIAKYDANGNLLWARGGSSGSPQDDDTLEIGQNSISQIAVDGNGNPYVAGSASGSNFLGAPTANNGETEILVAKLNPINGAVVWQRTIGGAKDDAAADLEVDSAGNLYVIGTFGSPSITFPTSPATVFSNPDDEEIASDTFIAKFNSGGDNLWVERLGNERSIAASQIAVSGAGEIFLTGYFFDSVTFETAEGEITLTETESDGDFERPGKTAAADDEEAGTGGFVAKMDATGTFVWAEGFGGVGKSLALDGAGKVYVVGTFWDGGTFGLDTANEDVLASFGGADLFVARYDGFGNFDFAKPIVSSSLQGQTAVIKPADVDSFAPPEPTENNYSPLGIAYNPARGTMFVSSDFQTAVALDCITFTAPDRTISSYVAELTPDGETTSCRIWNGLDEDDNDFDSPDNWNGGILPVAGDSVYVPYTGFDFDPPTFNPAMNIPLGNVTVADDRILTLEKDLIVNGRLDLLGGYVDAGNFLVSLGTAAQSFSTADGLVLGRVQKQFAAESARNFTFPVGSASPEMYPQYSPVTLTNVIGTGIFSVTANYGAYPHPANGLPANRFNRWWNLSNGGLTRADLTFKYVDGDLTAGTESEYRAYRIPAGGGTATQVFSAINPNAQTVFAPNVSQFSDWTIAQPLAPTAATATISGRVLNGHRAVSNARVSMTDASGNSRFAATNSFGYYRFADVATGGTYIFEVNAKRFEFAAQVINVNEDVNDLNFTER